MRKICKSVNLNKLILPLKYYLLNIFKVYNTMKQYESIKWFATWNFIHTINVKVVYENAMKKFNPFNNIFMDV